MGNSLTGSKVYICATAQAAALANAAAYVALTWVEIKNVGTMGEVGTAVNMLNYPTWGAKSSNKSKGQEDYGSPELEVMRDTADTGQNALRTAAATNLNYAIKIERNDKLTGGGTNTIIYNRGLVAGPRRPQGGTEDFDVEIFTLAFQDPEIVVAPS